jgi:hypothetical protein
MVQLPEESVTTVDFPSELMLLDVLPVPFEFVWVIVPAGPVVEPDTLPPPAVTDVDIVPLGAD